MADVTGPISSMPGSRHTLPEGSTCDQHPLRPAVIRVQGETDSFGSEMVDMCAECEHEYIAYRNSDKPEDEGYCQKPPGCGGRAKLFAYRDWEEGSCGPVYHICGPCKAHLVESDNKALAEMDDDRDYDYDSRYPHDED